MFAGLIVGTITTFVWYLTPALSDLSYELIPAFLAGLTVTWLVSLATRKPEGVTQMFDAMEG